MAATIAPTGRITRTPRTRTPRATRTPRTGTPGNGWARVAGWFAYGVAWLVTVWFVAPLSYAWTFRAVRWPLFPLRVVWHVLRYLTVPIWAPVRAAWRRSVARKGSVVRRVHKSARRGRRAAVRTAADLYGVSR